MAGFRGWICRRWGFAIGATLTIFSGVLPTSIRVIWPTWRGFFKTYYVPNNAVLLILGDGKAGEGLALAEKYFGDIPSGAAPPFADPKEPEQKTERRGNVEEKFGTLPAIAIGYTVPERRTTDWCAMALLDQALHGGRAGRVYRDLVLENEVAVEADGGSDYIFRSKRPQPNGRR